MMMAGGRISALAKRFPPSPASCNRCRPHTGLYQGDQSEWWTGDQHDNDCWLMKSVTMMVLNMMMIMVILSDWWLWYRSWMLCSSLPSPRWRWWWSIWWLATPVTDDFFYLTILFCPHFAILAFVSGNVAAYIFGKYLTNSWQIFCFKESPVSKLEKPEEAMGLLRWYRADIKRLLWQLWYRADTKRWR